MAVASPGRGAYSDKDRIGGRNGGSEIGRESKPSHPERCVLREWASPGSKSASLTLEGRDLRAVLVDAGYMMPEIGEAGA
jgi:hypothetical protein